jgi:hypothetical protein
MQIFYILTCNTVFCKDISVVKSREMVIFILSHTYDYTPIFVICIILYLYRPAIFYLYLFVINLSVHVFIFGVNVARFFLV